jgi:hypothetical protein
MEQTAKRILRSNDVELQGQVQLNVSTPGYNPVKQQSVSLSPPSVRILENTPEFAIVELTCSCGLRTQVKCQYVPEQSG